MKDHCQVSNRWPSQRRITAALPVPAGSAPSAGGSNLPQDPSNVLGHPHGLERSAQAIATSGLQGRDAIQGLPPVRRASQGPARVAWTRVGEPGGV